MRLKEIHKEIGRILYIKDPKIIDLVLSVMISREQKSTKLWLVIIDNSGGGKSELLKLFDDEGKTTKYLSKITKNTIISGLRGKGKRNKKRSQRSSKERIRRRSTKRR